MNRKLNGLLYFHRISDPRFGGEARRNLWMFRHLCGTEAYPNVVIVTTFWDSVTDEIGTRREEQLRSTAFKDLVEGGAHFMRHDRTLKSALEVVRQILTFTQRDPRIVEEIQKEGKSLEETEAGNRSLHCATQTRTGERPSRDGDSPCTQCGNETGIAGGEGEIAARVGAVGG